MDVLNCTILHGTSQAQEDKHHDFIYMEATQDKAIKSE